MRIVTFEFTKQDMWEAVNSKGERQESINDRIRFATECKLVEDDDKLYIVVAIK